MDKALAFLRKDKGFRALIKKHGPPVTLGARTNPFQALVRAIIYQQISGKAAASIMKKFEALFPGKKFPRPDQVRALTAVQLRKAGISPQKAAYLLDLAEKFYDGTIQPKKFSKMSNEEISLHLVQVKGIGQWTADMFLIFTLGRLDVLPVGDLGIQRGFKVHYNLRKYPTVKQMEKLAKPWREYASVGCWYLWRVADENK